MTDLNPDDLKALFAAARAMYYQGTVELPPVESPPPAFITISRQPGAGGRTLARALARRLNETNPAGAAWTCWDHELLEKVAAEHQIRMQALEAYEDERASPLLDFLKGLSATDDPSDPPEYNVHRRVSSTMRALAQGGRCILVGRGGVLATAGVPGGIHVRLVAPLAYRVEAVARGQGVDMEEAAEWVGRTEESRAAFYRRHWPTKPLLPETFTITLNTAAVPVDRAAEAILQLVPRSGRHAGSCRRCSDPSASRAVAGAAIRTTVGG